MSRGAARPKPGETCEHDPWKPHCRCCLRTLDDAATLGGKHADGEPSLSGRNVSIVTAYSRLSGSSRMSRSAWGPSALDSRAQRKRSRRAARRTGGSAHLTWRDTVWLPFGYTGVPPSTSAELGTLASPMSCVAQHVLVPGWPLKNPEPRSSGPPGAAHRNPGSAVTIALLRATRNVLCGPTSERASCPSSGRVGVRDST